MKQGMKQEAPKKLKSSFVDGIQKWNQNSAWIWLWLGFLNHRGRSWLHEWRKMFGVPKIENRLPKVDEWGPGKNHASQDCHAYRIVIMDRALKEGNQGIPNRHTMIRHDLLCGRSSPDCMFTGLATPSCAGCPQSLQKGLANLKTCKRRWDFLTRLIVERAQALGGHRTNW
jgi:hypothetical protein